MVARTGDICFGRCWTGHLIEAEALSTLAKLPDACVDAVVTDPPYGIAFGGKAWDRFASTELSGPAAFERWTQKWAAECLRVLKPGGHLLAFGAPRTCHRLTSAIEDAGFQIRDVLMWLNTQGMPKSRRLPGGLGTALKPTYEPILLARKPLVGTTTQNLSTWGTGALNIETTRVDGYWPAHVMTSHAPACTDKRCTAACPVRIIDTARPDLPPSRLFFCPKATRSEREAGCERLPARAARLYNGASRTSRAAQHPPHREAHHADALAGAARHPAGRPDTRPVLRQRQHRDCQRP